MTRPLRIMVVDDHAMLRRGLGLVIAREDDLELVAEAACVEDAVREARRTSPNIVLLDVHLPGASGIAGIRRLRETSHEIHIVILSMYDDFEHVRRAFAEGAEGYVVKSSTHGELLDALRAVARGEVYRDPSLPNPDGPNATRSPIEVLSPREREVLQLLALGNTNHEIADELVVSVKTVETHRAHIMNKLKVDSRAELVQHALAAGLLEVD
jgi:two-component system response regulator NreC